MNKSTPAFFSSVIPAKAGIHGSGTLSAGCAAAHGPRPRGNAKAISARPTSSFVLVDLLEQGDPIVGEVDRPLGRLDRRHLGEARFQIVELAALRIFAQLLLGIEVKIEATHSELLRGDNGIQLRLFVSRQLHRKQIMVIAET